ncbi:MAG TPA: hypothetical protein VEY70_16045 [Metabacillus sp.]|nr:hypothetical protein [Metabacillus sp.]
MENFISLLVFTLPGLLAYFWIQLFGLTPALKRSGTELLTISALLWIPITVTTLLIYQFIVVIYEHNPYYSINLPVVKNLKDLTKVAQSMWFLLYYIVCSLVISYGIARYIVGRGYDKFISHVNKIRMKNGKAPFSQHSTVWDEIFSKNNAQIVEIYNLNNPKTSVVGELRKVSRSFEPERHLTIEHVEHWTNILSKYEVRVENIFVDVKSSMVIKTYNQDDLKEAQDLYNQSKNVTV